MGDRLAKSYLEGKIGPLLGSHARDGVLQYLTSFDVSQPETEREMITYLEELLGRNPTYTTVVKQYIRMMKTFSPISAPANVSSESTGKKGKGKNKAGAGSSAQAAEDKKAPKSCDCMASRHTLRGSCTGCGMIYCVESNNSKCSYCGEVVRPPMTAEQAKEQGMSDKAVAAYAQKDKLLMFDKENAKRTAVHDAQADYYQSTSWMSQEEREAAKARDVEHSEARKASRLRKPINVSFDIAGRRFTEEVQGLNIGDKSSAAHQAAAQQGGSSHATASGASSLSTGSTGGRSYAGAEAEGYVYTGLENLELASSYSGSGSRAADVYRDLKSRLLEKYGRNEDRIST